MGFYKNFVQRASGNNFILTFGAVAFSVGCYISYKGLYKPWATRRMYSQNEEFAKILIEQPK